MRATFEKGFGCRGSHFVIKCNGGVGELKKVARPLQIRWLDLMLISSRLCKPHFDCPGTAIVPLTDLKFYLLPFS